MAQLLNHLAVLICDETSDLERAKPLYEESLALAREVGDQIGEAKVLVNQGATAYEQKDYAEARRLYQDSLELYRALDNRRGIAAVLNNLGLVASDPGDYVTARELIHESLDIKREIGVCGAVVHALMEMGSVTREMGEYRESSRWYREALALAWEIQTLHLVRHIIVGVAQLLDRQGEKERAPELLFFVQRQDGSSSRFDFLVTACRIGQFKIPIHFQLDVISQLRVGALDLDVHIGDVVLKLVSPFNWKLFTFQFQLTTFT